MDEYIDVVDEHGKPTGVSELKSIIHKKGYFHNTVHIWFYTKNGDILLSQRSAKKNICPLLWDVSVAGHINAGETIIEAAIRETFEEINLIIVEADLKKISVFESFQTYPNGIIDNEFHHSFICELETDLSKLIPQEGEVEALKLVTLSEFEIMILDDDIGKNNHFIASNLVHYVGVLCTVQGQVIAF